MRLWRTLPPAAAPIGWRDLGHAITGALTRTETVRARERELREEFGVDGVFLVSSGSGALALTLRALRTLSSRTEVIIPAYTCFSLPAAVLEAGLRPVPCDINPSTFDLDRAMLRLTLSPQTLCVIGHHLFGVPSDMTTLKAMCRDNGSFLIEDAAQAMGLEAGGRKLGTNGDVGIFSLGRGKNVTCGAGGIAITASPAIADSLAREHRRLAPPTIAAEAKDLLELTLMALFVRPILYWIPAALPFLHLGETVFPKAVPIRPMSGVRAGVLRGWQQRLTGSNRQRAEAATYYRHRLPLRLPPGGHHPYLRVPFRVRNAAEKQRLCAMSRRRGLGLSPAYPIAVTEIPGVPMACESRRFPSAQRVAASLVTIPTHPLVSEHDRIAIAELCRDFRSVS
jgi:dTDP-4-amino-4,6-dideoxygalactose transaminase